MKNTEEIIDTPDLNEARKLIQKFKKEGKEIIVKAQSNEFNRKILENKDVDILLSPEMHERKDFMKQKDSGLNEVLCRLAKKNNIKIGINLEEISRLEKKEKVKILGRVKQNILLCKKIKVPMIVFPRGKYDKRDIISFFVVLGGETWQGKSAIGK